jgi:hypothetical protein
MLIEAVVGFKRVAIIAGSSANVLKGGCGDLREIRRI